MEEVDRRVLLGLLRDMEFQVWERVRV